MANEEAAAWWNLIKTTAPQGLAGLWFGLTELVDGGWHLYVAGTATFDAADEMAEWAVGPYAWWPENRYLAMPEVAGRDVGAAVRHAAQVVRALAPWDHVDVVGIAVGFDDGDFEVVSPAKASDP